MNTVHDTSTVREAIKALQIGAAQTVRNLTMVPLLAPREAEPFYLTLDEALANGYARVTEVSDAGTVPELRFVNAGPKPVLLLDGEELVGAKQNRTLNLSILVPGQTTLTVPVSCVEAGRWHHVSPEFASEGRVFYAAGRARRARDVSEAMRHTGARVSRQGEVWADIAEKAERLAAPSATGAMSSMFDNYRTTLDEFRSALTAGTRQTGALFMIGGRTVGLDVFDAPATLRRVLPKLVGSYALDALDPENAESRAQPDLPDTFLDALAKASVTEFPAVGMGTDLRLEDAGLAGGGLAYDSRLVHLCAFALRPSSRGHSGLESGLASASWRRRHWRV